MLDLQLSDTALLKNLASLALKDLFPGEKVRLQTDYEIRNHGKIDFVATTGYQAFTLEDRVNKTLSEIKSGKIMPDDDDALNKSFKKYKSWYKLDKVFLISVKTSLINRDDVLSLLDSIRKYQLEDESRLNWVLGTVRGMFIGYEIEDKALELIEAIGFIEFHKVKTSITLNILPCANNSEITNATDTKVEVTPEKLLEITEKLKNAV